MSVRPVIRHVLVIVLVVASQAIAACADKRGGTIPYDRALGAPDEPKITTLAQDYKILPLDTLTIKVFKGDDLSGDYDVDLLGNISLPLVGEVRAATLTPDELKARLAAKLGERYLENPDVSVGIKESRSRTVTVDGAVREGGTYPVVSPVTLIQAVAMAKGTTEDANPRRVAVFRTIGGERQAAAFDLTDIRRGRAPDPTIYPGDIVVVDGSSIKAFQKQIFQSVPLAALFRPF